MKEHKFLSVKTNFCGTEGYMVTQLIGDKVVCEQFIPADGYSDFCKAINIIPELRDQ